MGAESHMSRYTDLSIVTKKTLAAMEMPSKHKQANMPSSHAVVLIAAAASLELVGPGMELHIRRVALGSGFLGRIIKL